MSGEQFRADHLVEYGAAAEKAGFDIAWASDHFQPWQDNQGHSSFAWATLAAVTQRTNRMILGTGVTCPSYRYQPSIVAEAFATLSILAPGRVFLGVGTGEAMNEQASGAADWAAYPERAERMAEAIEIIRKLWTGEWVQHEGKHWTIPKAKLYDVPSRPVPIWVAANGPISARLAGRHGDGWITTTTALDDEETYQAFEEGAREAGKDPGAIEIVLETFAVVGSEDEATAGAKKWRFLQKAWEPGFLDNPDPVSIQKNAEEQIPLDEVTKEWPIGTDPEVHVNALRELFAKGASTLFIHSPQPDQKAFVEWYGKHVLPHFSQAKSAQRKVGL